MQGIKKIFEIEQGQLYWITFGDKEFKPTEKMRDDLQRLLADMAPKCDFIVTPYFIKPIELRNVIEKSELDSLLAEFLTPVHKVLKNTKYIKGWEDAIKLLIKKLKCQKKQ